MGTLAILLTVSPTLAASNRVRITKLTDPAFGSIANLGVNATRTQNVCLYSDTNTGGYNITAGDIWGEGVRWPVIKACKTAVLWWKACSTATPDYFVEYLPDNPWIHQPFEIYDNLRPEGLKARLGATSG